MNPYFISGTRVFGCIFFFILFGTLILFLLPVLIPVFLIVLLFLLFNSALIFRTVKPGTEKKEQDDDVIDVEVIESETCDPEKEDHSKLNQ